MSAYSYVDTPNSNLTCCICRSPFIEPVTTTTCSHTFCYECILDALSHAAQCPIDRLPLTSRELGSADSIVRALVDELLVECVHREEGCRHVCQRQLLPAHLREDCEHSEVLCPERDCTERMARRDLNAHMKSNHNEESKVKSRTKDPVNRELNGGSLNCPQSRNGCLFTATAKDALSAHITSCSYHDLNGIFGLSAARHASLVEQNVLLRHRVSTLETSVQVLRREMEAVRRALGPWFRLEGSSGQHNWPPTSALRPNGLEGGSANQDVPTATPATDAGGVQIGTDTLASYFDDGHAGQHRTAPSTSASGRMGQISETFPIGSNSGFPPMRTPIMLPLGPQASSSRPVHTPGIMTVPQLTSVITPLDTGSTLEGSLIGLRDSVMTLAAGVDSLGWRSEIALTNESLRFGEETMSLRSSINGLRMQVHTMMMERNAQVVGSGLIREEGLAPPRPFYPAPVQGPMSITKL